MAGTSTHLTWRAAPNALKGLVAGFAERQDGQMRPGACELPLALPLLQVFLSGHYAMDGARVPEAGLWGPSSHARPAEAQGALHVFVVILTLRGARILTGRPVSGLVERVAPIDEVRPDWQTLRERLILAGDFEARAAVMAAELQRAFAAAEAPPLLALADAVAGHRLRGNVASLGEASGIGARALQKRFMSEIGWPPKLLMRVARLQRVLRMLHPGSWSAPAGDAFLEYTDEAHMARDFRALTGLTPSAYVRAKQRSGDRLLHTILTDPAAGGQPRPR